MAIPRNLRELQGLLGQLLFAAPHIPGYKALVRPIEALLSPKTHPVWTVSCTRALNQLLSVIFARVRLTAANPTGQLTLYPSVSDNVAFVAFT